MKLPGRGGAVVWELGFSSVGGAGAVVAVVVVVIVVVVVLVEVGCVSGLVVSPSLHPLHPTCWRRPL